MEKYFCDTCGTEILEYEEDKNLAQIADKEYDLCDSCIAKVISGVESLKSA